MNSTYSTAWPKNHQFGGSGQVVVFGKSVATVRNSCAFSKRRAYSTTVAEQNRSTVGLDDLIGRKKHATSTPMTTHLRSWKQGAVRLLIGTDMVRLGEVELLGEVYSVLAVPGESASMVNTSWLGGRYLTGMELDNCLSMPA